MKYLPTPLNAAALFLVIVAIYSYVTSPEGGDGLQNVWVIPMIMLAVVIVVIDYFLQKHITPYKKVLLIEGAFLLCFYIFTRFSLQPETFPSFLIPDSFNQDFIAVIYDVEGAPKLFAKAKAVEVPTDGILLTSKKLGGVQTAMTFDGTLADGEMVNGYSTFYGKTQCGGKTYDYQVWYLKTDTEFPEKEASIESQVNDEMNKYCESNLK